MAGGPPKIDIIRVRCGLSKIDRIWQGVKKGPFLTPQEGGPPKQGGPPSYQRQIFSKNCQKKMH